MVQRMALGEMLLNRVRKNERKLARWRKREQATCYRIYDRDIPEIPLTLDRYGDHLHVAVWSRKRDREHPDAAHLRYVWLAQHIGAALGVDPTCVHLKERERQRGSQQYTQVDKQRRRFEVQEGGLKFLVNLSDYLDTGLFLDHRQTRAMVRDEAEGTEVLNLFAYTGSFSVYAAAGGAVKTTTVDLSQTYCDWAKANLALNGFNGRDHEVIRDDVKTFVRGAREAGMQWDIVVCDPPTFSNSKRTESTFDIEREQTPMMQALHQIIRPGGVLYYSTNFRKFTLNDSTFDGYDATEISQKTVPPDFRDRRIHRCWRALRRGG